MDSQTAFNRIEQSGIVCGMRGAFPPEAALHVTDILMQAGINCFEMTMNSEQPIEAMQAVKREYGADAVVGMGTVFTVQDARRVLDAGTDFVVSPAFQPEIVQTILDADVLMAPGVATPSEAVAAWNMGVKLLKIFPIGALGIDYFKAIYGPLNHMKFMCNGAITAENATEFMKIGATAVGMAGWVTGNGAPHDDATLKQRATAIYQAIEFARTGQKPMREI